MSILLTGGMGYIGSHTAVTLIEAGYEVTLFDNLSNSDLSVLQSLEKITHKKIPYEIGTRRASDFNMGTMLKISSKSITYCKLLLYIPPILKDEMPYIS